MTLVISVKFATWCIDEDSQSQYGQTAQRTQVYVCESQGNFIHVAPLEPCSDWDCGFEVPWWKNPDEYCIGKLTAGTVLIRVMNMLTGTEDFLEVQ